MHFPTVLIPVCLIIARALTAEGTSDAAFQQALNSLVDRVEKLEETVNKQSVTIDGQKEEIQRLTDGIKGKFILFVLYSLILWILSMWKRRRQTE